MEKRLLEVKELNNKTIRQKALARVKTKHLTLLMVISYLLTAAGLLMGDLTGNRLRDAAILLGYLTLVSLFSYVGRLRVGMESWRQGKAEFASYFRCAMNGNLLARGLSVALPRAALLTGVYCAARYLSFWAGAAAAAGAWLVLLFLNYAAYGMELNPEKGIGFAFGRGFAAAGSGLGRLLAMKLALHGWTVGTLIGIGAICYFAGAGQMATGIIEFLCAGTLTWMIGACNALAEAGLARELFK